MLSEPLILSWIEMRENSFASSFLYQQQQQHKEEGGGDDYGKKNILPTVYTQPTRGVDASLRTYIYEQIVSVSALQSSTA